MSAPIKYRFHSTPEQQAQKFIESARARVGDTVWRMIGPDLRQALACEVMVRSMSGKSTDDTSAEQAQRLLLTAQAIMSADFDA